MKMIIVLLASVVFTTTGFSQNEKYKKAMAALVPGVDPTWNKDELIVMGISFERIASAEKTQWLPYYYAALANINAGYTYASDGSFGDKSKDIDPLADKAEQLINKADELNKN